MAKQDTRSSWVLNYNNTQDIIVMLHSILSYFVKRLHQHHVRFIKVIHIKKWLRSIPYSKWFTQQCFLPTLFLPCFLLPLFPFHVLDILIPVSASLGGAEFNKCFLIFFKNMHQYINTFLRIIINYEIIFFFKNT